jgi:hypothetical protein
MIKNRIRANSRNSAGVDVKYGLTSNLVLNLTGNTDFADTEVDLEPFNLTPIKVLFRRSASSSSKTQVSSISIWATRINCSSAARLAG